jgi:hypothetical protein
MDFKQWGLSLVAVYAALYVVGLGISVLSSQLQCSKINWSTSAVQGGLWATYPTVVYALSTYFEFIRKPFSNTLAGFGIPQDTAEVVGIGYLVMLMIWIATVWNIHNTEKTACNPDLKEMSEFKKKLLAELQQKEEQKEHNAEIKK